MTIRTGNAQNERAIQFLIDLLNVFLQKNSTNQLLIQKETSTSSKSLLKLGENARFQILLSN